MRTREREHLFPQLGHLLWLLHTICAHDQRQTVPLQHQKVYWEVHFQAVSDVRTGQNDSKLLGKPGIQPVRIAWLHVRSLLHLPFSHQIPLMTTFREPRTQHILHEIRRGWLTCSDLQIYQRKRCLPPCIRHRIQKKSVYKV